MPYAKAEQGSSIRQRAVRMERSRADPDGIYERVLSLDPESGDSPASTFSLASSRRRTAWCTTSGKRSTSRRAI